MERVLITGGAGFIGRHLAQALIERGDRVRVLDCFHEQVHGAGLAALPADIEVIRGDIRDGATVRRALEGAGSVVHLAAEVGVGQSMYAIERYVGVNDLGTAVLMEALTTRPVRRVVVASSMSIYGEGLYRDALGGLRQDITREPGGPFDPTTPDGLRLEPVPTPEWKRPNLSSVYALTKFVQEQLVLTLAPHYGMEGVALRLFNTYGPGQALSNPYTGVLAIFASRLLNGEAPLVFEDGAQRRDVVHVSDVVRAFLLALDAPAAAGEVFNIASGEARSISELARLLAGAMGIDRDPIITGKVRAGDIRHCFADIGKARAKLGFEPKMELGAGLSELAGWVSGQKAVDRVEDARRELADRGLVA